MEQSRNDKRKFERFKTDMEIAFSIAIDLKTQVNFQIIDKDADKVLSRKYVALSKNVSVEGLCFTCQKKLKEGDLLHLEVYASGARVPTFMKAQVRWSVEAGAGKYDTGVRILNVGDRSIEDTFHRDAKKQVVWSGVLQSVLGNFEEQHSL